MDKLKQFYREGYYLYAFYAWFIAESRLLRFAYITAMLFRAYMWSGRCFRAFLYDWIAN